MIPILFYADTTNVGLIVVMNLQKRPVKKLALIPVFCSVCFIQRSIISVEVPLYGFNEFVWFYGFNEAPLYGFNGYKEGCIR